MRKARQATGKGQEQPKRFCRDCSLSYDWHSVALDGHLILCRCPVDERTEQGRWCKFLSDPACIHFKPKKNDNNGTEEETTAKG